MRRSSLSIVLAVFCGVSAADAFELKETRTLHLDWQGAPLIVGDFLGDPDELAKADGWKASNVAGGNAVNVHRSSSDWLDYRREMVATGDTAELAVRFSLRAYHEKKIGVVRYGFRMPTERLDGVAYRAVTQRSDPSAASPLHPQGVDTSPRRARSPLHLSYRRRSAGRSGVLPRTHALPRRPRPRSVPDRGPRAVSAADRRGHRGARIALAQRIEEGLHYRLHAALDEAESTTNGDSR